LLYYLKLAYSAWENLYNISIFVPVTEYQDYDPLLPSRKIIQKELRKSILYNGLDITKNQENSSLDIRKPVPLFYEFIPYDIRYQDIN
jgi:hypothetical protein